MTVTISSLQNPRVKAAVRLRERRHREASGQMLVEGYHELALACAAGVRPLELFLAPELLQPGEAVFLAELRQIGVPVVEVTPAVMAKLAYREHPDAWLAVADIPVRTLADLTLGSQPLLVIAEAVEKPGNLGAILRSADAAGADAVIVCDSATDLYNPNVVRASKGTLFQLPVVAATSAATFAWLAERGIRIVASTPAATASFWQSDLKGGVAIAVGTEKEGLSQGWLARAEVKVAIPMCGRANSLNVAQAATLLLYEALRQRVGKE
jgi:TrmH family RNA methyltransferase